MGASATTWPRVLSRSRRPPRLPGVSVPITPTSAAASDAWDDLGARYAELLALPHGAREGWLAREIARNPGRARDLCELLAADAQGGDTLDALAPGALDSWVADLLGAGAGRARATGSDLVAPGTVVGPYRVGRAIGRGGSAVVYEATGAHDSAPIALKLLREEWRGTPVAERFARERHLLARLQHPHVAALRDAGTADDGRAYLAVDLVDGLPIDRWCAEQRIDVRGRVTLLLDVCGAVAHAHRQLVVHRDLKPANVLVDRRGHAWLLDFGVARLLEGAPDGIHGPEPTLTRPGEGAPCTPAYAAPEILRGEPASTAADVYALGVLLYELLTGSRPHDVDALPRLSAAAAIAGSSPMAPSDRIAGGPLPPALPVTPTSTPAADRTRAATLVRGDLDAVALTALAAQPDRRYPTVDAFADDLRAWLAARGVRARPAAWREHARRWGRRHRGAAVALAVGIPIALAGLGGTAWEWRRANLARARAEVRDAQIRTLVGSLLFEVYDGIADLPGAAPVRDRLAARALAQLEPLADQALATPGADDPRAFAELARALQRLGDVRGNPTNANLGDPDAARAAFARSLALAERAAAAAPTDPALAWVAATQLERVAEMRATAGDPAGALALQRQAVARRRAILQRVTDAARDGVRAEVAGGMPGLLPMPVTGVTAARALAISLVKLGDVAGHPVFTNAGDPATARLAYEEAVARLDAPPSGGDTAFVTRRYQALARERLGRMLALAGDHAGARATLEASLTRRLALAAERPASIDARRDAEIAHLLVAEELLDTGDISAALPHARTALNEATALAAADPHDVRLRRDVAIAEGAFARAVGGRGPLAEAAVGRARIAWAAYLGGRAATRADQLQIDALGGTTARLRAVP